MQTLLSTRLYTCVYNARQYSVVKDLDCLSNQFQRASTRLNSLLISRLLLVGVVGPDGIEPSTSPLSGVRSSHLSYGPRCFPSQHWWSWSGSNRRPPECKSGALPAELQPLFGPAAPSSSRNQPRPSRFIIEASWIQGPRISNPQPLSDSLPYALSGDPVACSLMIPGLTQRTTSGLWNGTTAPYSPTLYTQALLAFGNSIHGLS